jgi:hypothetical protein
MSSPGKAAALVQRDYDLIKLSKKGREDFIGLTVDDGRVTHNDTYN